MLFRSANYDRALKVAPDRAFLFGERLFCRMNVCDWRGIANDFAGLEALIEAGNPASAPFPVLAMPLSTASQKANAETYARAMYSHKEPAPQFARGGGHERIRLGYFSSDFHNHAIPFLIADLFERHDRSKFEIIAFSISPPVNDAMHARLEKAFDRFVEAGVMPDGEVVSLARDMKIDIAVDLNGFTKHNRAGIFARRVAPVQVNYLGYPGTMGCDFIDYILADPILIPEAQRRHYTETVAYLPNTYQPNDPRRPISDRVLSRSECGLPEKKIGRAHV